MEVTVPKYKQGLAFRYIQGTKYHRDRPLSDDLGSIPAPERFKNYPDAERLQLPEPDLSLPADLWQCLTIRRSERDTRLAHPRVWRHLGRRRQGDGRALQPGPGVRSPDVGGPRGGDLRAAQRVVALVVFDAQLQG